MGNNISSLIGETMVKIIGAERESEEIIFTAASGRSFRMWHIQDCCEAVSVEDVVGDVDDLIGSPIVRAEERRNDLDDPPADANAERYYDESATWTFYELATIKGSVTLRWLGTSNGYYSERVSFAELIEPSMLA